MVQAEFCVKEAIEAGFRHIDSAEGYHNEEGTGKGIKAAGISRDELFVTTKLFPGYKQWGATEKTYEQTIETLKNQLKQLQLEYVDLYLIHAPLSTWRVEEGQGGEVLADIKKECQLVTNEIATKIKVSEAKLLLRWGLQHGYCVLTKSSKPERIRENLDLFDFDIPATDMANLNRLNQNQAIAWAASGLNPMEVAPPLK